MLFLTKTCDDIDNGTKKSMAFVKTENDEVAKLKARIAELEANTKANKEESSEINIEDDNKKRMDNLRARAKELKISGYALPSMSEDKLKSKIEEAEAELK